MKYLKYTLLSLVLICLAALYLSLGLTNGQPEYSKPVIANFNKTKYLELDSIEVVASTLYIANNFKIFMQGDNYRTAWETPIKVPVLNLNTIYGGLTPLEKGGGKQTNSLKLMGKDSIIYTIRSINKDPSPLVPKIGQILGLSNVVVDGISAQHPFASSVVAKLSNKIDILNTRPKLYFVPKQAGLSEFSEAFGDKLYWLEYENKNETNWTSRENVIDIIDTDNLIKLKQKKLKTVFVNERKLIRNRLFDFLIGDWDRHAKQWGWVLQERDNITYAEPLATDRDNAFFSVSGIIPSILSNKNVIEELRPFEETIDHLPGLVQDFDRYFLLHTDKELFIDEAKFLQKQLTRQAIENAFKVWPKQISDLDKTTIMKKIISRKAHLVEYAIQFKESIVEKGAINDLLKGSEKLELSQELLHSFQPNKPE